jgi:hypothetical protein
LSRQGAKIVQYPLAQQIGVMLTSFRKLDDSLGDHRDDRIVSIRKSQRGTRYLECDPHDAFGLGRWRAGQRRGSRARPPTEAAYSGSGRIITYSASSPQSHR